MSKSDAEATVEFAIFNGLSENAHITGINATQADGIIVPDIMGALFDPAFRWAVKEYIKEIEKE